MHININSFKNFKVKYTDNKNELMLLENFHSNYRNIACPHIN